jgi:hypothetical protein
MGFANLFSGLDPIEPFHLNIHEYSLVVVAFHTGSLRTFEGMHLVQSLVT